MSGDDLKLDWDAVDLEGDTDAPEVQDNPEHGQNEENEMDEDES